MAKKQRTFISFDWALKRLLRDKANYDVLEGFLSTLLNQDIKIELGHPDKQAGQAAFISLEAAVQDLKAGLIDVLVTAPISKENIQSDQFHYPGHTEYLESAAGDGNKAMMVLCTGNLRVALVTIHTPLGKVPSQLTVEGIREKLRLLDASLKRDFGLDGPRIAVLSLNPHAGENGILGTEERDIIVPALQQALDEDGVQCFGPYAADGFFGARQYRRFDAVLAMYHDQGLAPFKTIAMNEGVNFTAGLPIVRTSPDHGTGYDIAGQGIADETSMRQAIYAAIDYPEEVEEQLAAREEEERRAKLEEEKKAEGKNRK